jgi:hypothetical protein
LAVRIAGGVTPLNSRMLSTLQTMMPQTPSHSLQQKRKWRTFFVGEHSVDAHPNMWCHFEDQLSMFGTQGECSHASRALGVLALLATHLRMSQLTEIVMSAVPSRTWAMQMKGWRLGAHSSNCHGICCVICDSLKGGYIKQQVVSLKRQTRATSFHLRAAMQNRKMRQRDILVSINPSSKTQHV